MGELAVVRFLRVLLDHELSIQIGSDGIAMDLRHWVNEGLMTFFFLGVGLEARRELDMGALRDRRRITLPLMGAAGGMVLAVLIYVAFNAGGVGAHGWGAAMTDTAFALGVLALVAPGATRLRVRLLTLRDAGVALRAGRLASAGRHAGRGGHVGRAL